MPHFKLSELLRRIMSDTEPGDPAWKRQTAAAVVMGLGLVPALPDIWKWIEAVVHFFSGADPLTGTLQNFKGTVRLVAEQSAPRPAFH